MNTPTLRGRYRLALLMASAALATAGCGGGDTPAAPASPSPPAPLSITGVVLGGAGATVCLDTNSSGNCNAGETTTTAGATGAFTLGPFAATPRDGVAVVAEVPAGSLGASYVLTAPASRASVVSPITSVVQAGVTQGLGLQASEAAVALQLQVSAANLYADYISGPSGADGAALAAIGAATVDGLRLGMPLVVAPTPNTTPDYTVYQFNYTNAQTYIHRRYYHTSTLPDATTGRHPFYMLAGGLANGEPRMLAFGGAWASTPAGWAPLLNQANTHFVTTGNPSIQIGSNGYRQINTWVDVDVAGHTIADVVRQAQNLAVNTEATIFGLNPDTLAGTMPAGAKLRRMRTVNVDAPLFYNIYGGGSSVPGATTLTNLVAAFPTLAMPSEVTTAWIGAVTYPDLCTPPTGSDVCPAEGLRASFGPGNTVNYYLCDWNVYTGESTNCTATAPVTYSIVTALDNVTPMMTFTNLPAPTLANVTLRTLIQRDGIYVATRARLAPPTTRTLLNRVAFESLTGALSLPAPAVGPVSPYFGFWRVTYDGPESGGCEDLLVDALGTLTSRCFALDMGRAFTLAGAVSNLGEASFSSPIADTFTGTFLPATASGTWVLGGTGTSGNWTAMRH